ncbi:MAG: PorP/SprF family type IX secretion system membrane protein [Bacteroidia bacterium]
MKRIFVIISLLAAAASFAQHNAMFSQYMFNGLLINPAYAGSNDVLNATAIDRIQWTGFDGAPKTLSFSLHSPLKNKKVNLGISFINDQIGITTQNKINAVYAYRLFFGKSSLAFGLQGGVNMSRSNWNKIQTTTSGDQTFTGGYVQQNIAETGFGIYYKSPKIFAGISAPDLFSIGTTHGKLYKPALLTAGYLISISEDVKLKPSILIKYIKNSPQEFDFNLNAYYKNLGVGVSYRTNDAMVFLIQYNINMQLSAGYSYDLTTSKLHTFVRGSHEIMLKYEFGFKVNPQSPRYF